jgi:hypothetical protein
MNVNTQSLSSYYSCKIGCNECSTHVNVSNFRHEYTRSILSKSVLGCYRLLYDNRQILGCVINTEIRALPRYASTQYDIDARSLIHVRESALRHWGRLLQALAHAGNLLLFTILTCTNKSLISCCELFIGRCTPANKPSLVLGASTYPSWALGADVETCNWSGFLPVLPPCKEWFLESSCLAAAIAAPLLRTASKSFISTAIGAAGPVIDGRCPQRAWSS